MKLANLFNHPFRGFLGSDPADSRPHSGNGEGDKALFIGQPESGACGQSHVLDGNAHGRFGHGRRMNDPLEARAPARRQHGMAHGDRRLSPRLIFHV